MEQPPSSQHFLFARMANREHVHYKICCELNLRVSSLLCTWRETKIWCDGASKVEIPFRTILLFNLCTCTRDEEEKIYWPCHVGCVCAIHVRFRSVMRLTKTSRVPEFKHAPTYTNEYSWTLIPYESHQPKFKTHPIHQIVAHLTIAKEGILQGRSHVIPFPYSRPSCALPWSLASSIPVALAAAAAQISCCTNSKPPFLRKCRKCQETTMTITSRNSSKNFKSGRGLWKMSFQIISGTEPKIRDETQKTCVFLWHNLICIKLIEIHDKDRCALYAVFVYTVHDIMI